MRSSCPHGGDHPPTLTEVSANLRAGADWASRRDLPDIDGWDDLNAAPDLVRQCLISRLQEGRCPSVAHTFPLPKTGKDEVRKMAWLNPYDDLYFRIIVGRVARAVEAALGPDVFSYRLADDPPAWSVRDVRVAFRLRRERAQELLAEAGCNAIAVADLRHYYPSVEPEVVMNALYQANAPRGAVTLTVNASASNLWYPRVCPSVRRRGGAGNIVLLETRQGSPPGASHSVHGRQWLFSEPRPRAGRSRGLRHVSVDLGLEATPRRVAVYPTGSEAAGTSSSTDRSPT